MRTAIKVMTMPHRALFSLVTKHAPKTVKQMVKVAMLPPRLAFGVVTAPFKIVAKAVNDPMVAMQRTLNTTQNTVAMLQSGLEQLKTLPETA
jgi:hypothetical protein